MKVLLDLGLVIAGWSLVALDAGSLFIPHALRWREKLAALTPLMRSLFWTYSGYIWATHAFFAVLSLTCGEWLTGGSTAAAIVSAFAFLWWAVRLGIQFFGFDLAEVEDTPANRFAKHLLTLLFACLALLYGGLLCWNLGWLGNGGAS